MTPAFEVTPVFKVTPAFEVTPILDMTLAFEVTRTVRRRRAVTAPGPSGAADARRERTRRK